MKTFSEIEKMNSEELIESLQAVANMDRSVALQVIWHLCVMDKRALYLKAGYGSLWAYCVEVLKYDAGSAYRRVKAAKLWSRHPEIEADLKSGELTLSNAALLQAHFDHCEKQASPLSEQDQKQAIGSALGKSRRRLEADLIGSLPEGFPRPNQSVTVVAKNLNRMVLFVDDTFLKDLETLRDLMGHAEPTGDYAKTIHTAIREQLEKMKKRRFGSPSDSPEKLKAVQSSSNPDDVGKPVRAPIAATVRAEVYRRDRESCSYVNPSTLKRCGETFALEIDHIRPVQEGGTNTVENLRLLCRAHHRFRHQDSSVNSPAKRRYLDSEAPPLG